MNVWTSRVEVDISNRVDGLSDVGFRLSKEQFLGDVQETFTTEEGLVVENINHDQTRVVWPLAFFQTSNTITRRGRMDGLERIQSGE